MGWGVGVVDPLILGFRTMIFEFAVPNLALMRIFIQIRPFLRFEGVGRGRGRSFDFWVLALRFS